MLESGRKVLQLRYASSPCQAYFRRCQVVTCVDCNGKFNLPDTYITNHIIHPPMVNSFGKTITCGRGEWGVVCGGRTIKPSTNL